MLMKAGLSLLAASIVFAISITLFMQISPQFGASPQGDHLERIRTSPNYSAGRFQNLMETRMDLNLKSGLSVMKEWIFSDNARKPTNPLPVGFGESVPDNGHNPFVTWYGHSTVMLEMEGKKILIDPMLGSASSPVSFLSRRFKYQRPIDIDGLPEIDAVVISHDHYDHLDYPTIKAIKNRVGHFYTPLGVGAHLRKWGVDASRITELDWWEATQMEGIQLIAAPARHFSGRGINDRDKTQWASWVLLGTEYRVYFSGDSGYGPHFSEIGDRFGPFDFAMIECGQYNEKWQVIHMMPEESVQACIDVGGKVMMPIHWGAFNLSLHAWTDPVVRATAEAQRVGISIATPVIGQRFSIHRPVPDAVWWSQ
jgi:L-ascorbate metabolism protein UlaG (beta-lactamase superfamily)